MREAWQTIVAMFIGLSQIGCVTHLAAVEGQERLFRDKAGLYEVRIPDNLPKGWQWTLVPAAYEADLALALKRIVDNEAEIFIGHPSGLYAGLTGADLVTIAREFTRSYYANRDKLRGIKRIGDLVVTPQTSLQDILNLDNLLVQKTVGVHSIVESAPEIYEQPPRGHLLRSRRRLKGAVRAFLKVQDRMMLLLLLSDAESLDQNRQVLYQVIQNIRFLKTANH